MEEGGPRHPVLSLSLEAAHKPRNSRLTVTGRGLAPSHHRVTKRGSEPRLCDHRDPRVSQLSERSAGAQSGSHLPQGSLGALEKCVQ